MHESFKSSQNNLLKICLKVLENLENIEIYDFELMSDSHDGGWWREIGKNLKNFDLKL